MKYKYVVYLRWTNTNQSDIICICPTEELASLYIKDYLRGYSLNGLGSYNIEKIPYLETESEVKEYANHR